MTWRTLPFDKVFEDQTGGNIKTLQSEYLTAGKFPIIDQGQQLIGGYTDEAERLCKAKLPVVIFGDHTKSLKFVDFPFCLGADGTKILTPKIEAEPRYLFYFLQTVQIPDAGYSRHFKYLKKAEIPLPPLEEQKRIAAILDQADALRRLRARALDRLNALGQAIFHEMFGDWRHDEIKFPLVKLADLLDYLTSGSRGWAEFYAESGAAFIRIQNVGKDRFMGEDLAFVRAPATAEAKRTRVEAGDVLLSITADLGRTAVVPAEFGEAYINQHLAILRTQKLLPRYLSAAIASPAGQYAIARRNREGVKAGLNFDDVRAIEIPVPPRDIQQVFVERLDETEVLAQKCLEGARSSNSLFTSLQHRAFRGEL